VVPTVIGIATGFTVKDSTMAAELKWVRRQLLKSYCIAGFSNTGVHSRKGRDFMQVSIILYIIIILLHWINQVN
jgi:hypothetical protein